MSLELIKDYIKVIRVIGEESTQTIVENDIIVPDTKPDILRVLFVDGEVFMADPDVQQDKVTAGGTVQIKILYIGDEEGERLKSIEAETSFSHDLNILHTRQGMHCRVDCNIEHIEYEIVNARKINIKGILNVKGKVTNEVEQQVVHEISGVRGVQVLKDRYSVRSPVGRGEITVPVSEGLDIPPGKPTVMAILRSDAKLTDKEYKAADDRVVVRGEINVSTLYTADDEEESIQSMEHSIPFMQVINMPGIKEDMNLDVGCRISGWSCRMEEDSDGELRILRADVNLNIRAEGFYENDIEALADAYSMDSVLEIERETFGVEKSAASVTSQATLRDTMEIGAELPEMAEVFNVLCRPVLSSYEVEKDRVVIEGVAVSKVLYIADNEEQPVFLWEGEMPLRETVELEGVEPGMKCEVFLDVDHVSYNLISPRSIEIRVVMDMDTRVYKQISIPLVSGITELPADEAEMKSRPGIIIYFTQPGDTLWKVAKKYHVAVDDIRKANNVPEEEEVTRGQQLLIMNKKR